jgi:hypothetical protein
MKHLIRESRRLETPPARADEWYEARTNESEWEEEEREV